MRDNPNRIIMNALKRNHTALGSLIPGISHRACFAFKCLQYVDVLNAYKCIYGACMREQKLASYSPTLLWESVATFTAIYTEENESC